MQEDTWQGSLLDDRITCPAIRQQTLLTELLRHLLNECFLFIKQVFKVDLEDRFIVHVDDCGPTGRAKSVSMTKSDVPPPAHEASREKPRGADPELSPDLGGHRTGWS